VRRLARWSAYLMAGAALVLLTAALTWAFLARQQPPLQVWHREAPDSEWEAGDFPPTLSRQAYDLREERIFAELGDIEAKAAEVSETPPARFGPQAPMRPTSFARNWNRTFETAPGAVRGGALLLHGMTDGPYSMRAIADVLARAGYYSLAMRMPGHGTTPGGLERARAADWTAAVRHGVRLVRERVGEGRPLLLVGYSNGGALAVQYALDAVDDPALTRPDRVVLLSPMIGVSPFAGLSVLLPLAARVPYFDRAAWTSIQIEYNPFKYNSFPAMAGAQSHALTTELATRLERLRAAGRVGELPPVLTFQSVVDATVSSAAVVDVLHARLGDDSALVLFDVNRQAAAQSLVPPWVDALVTRLRDGHPGYRATLVTNEAPRSAAVVAREVGGGAQAADAPLGMSWPDGVFSLSHVAVPFRTTDPLYGLTPDPQENYGVRLGNLALRGERGVLVVGMDDVMRMASNPFFDYLATRVTAFVTPR
jgi:alpha-beta hydrolase superfamily lysophospholipase